VRVIDLALKDLMQTVRDWKAATFLLAMPIAFTLLFGAIFSGVGNEDDPRLPVGFLDRDGGSVLSVHLSDLLNASDAVRPVALEDEDLAEVKRKVSDEELAGAVVIPAGYTERVLAGEEARLTVIVNEASAAGTTARNGIQVAATRLRGAVQTAQLAAQRYERSSEARGVSADEAFLLETLGKVVDAWEEPPLTVSVTHSAAGDQGEASEIGTSEDDAGESNVFTQSSPAMMIQFSIAGLIGSAELLVLERKSRTMQRLLTTSISRLGIIFGHFLAILILILVQFALLIGFAQLVLGVDYMAEPLATLLMLGANALWTASLGLLVGVLAKTEEQAVMYAMILMFVLSALGGAWMPLETTSQTFQTIGHLMPTAWAMDGFKNIVARGLGLSAVMLPAGVLLAYAGVLFALALWRFRFE